jgi:hypothetical protein
MFRKCADFLLDEQSARDHWHVIHGLPFVNKLKEDYKAAQAARSMIDRCRDPQVYIAASSAVDDYVVNVRKGRLSGREMENEAHRVFSQYAVGMNAVETWSGKY